MTTITYNQKTLHCNVDANPDTWQDIYPSAQECMKGIVPDIIEDGLANGYNADEIDALMRHYSSVMGNSNQEWRG